MINQSEWRANTQSTHFKTKENELHDGSNNDHVAFRVAPMSEVDPRLVETAGFNPINKVNNGVSSHHSIGVEQYTMFAELFKVKSKRDVLWQLRDKGLSKSNMYSGLFHLLGISFYLLMGFFFVFQTLAMMFNTIAFILGISWLLGFVSMFILPTLYILFVIWSWRIMRYPYLLAKNWMFWDNTEAGKHFKFFDIPDHKALLKLTPIGRLCYCFNGDDSTSEHMNLYRFVQSRINKNEPISKDLIKAYLKDGEQSKEFQRWTMYNVCMFSERELSILHKAHRALDELPKQGMTQNETNGVVRGILMDLFNDKQRIAEHQASLSQRVALYEHVAKRLNMADGSLEIHPDMQYLYQNIEEPALNIKEFDEVMDSLMLMKAQRPLILIDLSAFTRQAVSPRKTIYYLQEQRNRFKAQIVDELNNQ